MKETKNHEQNSGNENIKTNTRTLKLVWPVSIFIVLNRKTKEDSLGSYWLLFQNINKMKSTFILWYEFSVGSKDGERIEKQEEEEEHG